MFVLMPKAPMHENRFTTRDKRQVWATWKIAAMESEASPKAMHHTANEHFGLGIFGSDRPHVCAATIRAEQAGHGLRYSEASGLIDMCGRAKQSCLGFITRRVRHEFAITEFETQLRHQGAVVFRI